MTRENGHLELMTTQNGIANILIGERFGGLVVKRVLSPIQSSYLFNR